MPRSLTPRRDHLIDVAQALFNERGYHQVGIDLIMKESGVSKATLYKYFKTKEELIYCILERRSKTTLMKMQMNIEELLGISPDASTFEKIDAIFSVSADKLNNDDFFGCNFVRAVAEYQFEDPQIVEFAKTHKARIKALFASYLPGGEDERYVLAEQIMLILDGAISAAHSRDRKDSAQHGRRLLKLLLDA